MSKLKQAMQMALDAMNRGYMGRNHASYVAAIEKLTDALAEPESVFIAVQRDGAEGRMGEALDNPKPVHASAEDYLRYRYGAYRGHFAWRELEEAYSQGRYDEAMAQGPDTEPTTGERAELIATLRSQYVDTKQMLPVDHCHRAADMLEATIKDSLIVDTKPIGYLLHNSWGFVPGQEPPEEGCDPVYMAPASRAPLTIAEVEEILVSWDYDTHGDRSRYIVRATEAAHGVRPVV